MIFSLLIATLVRASEITTVSTRTLYQNHEQPLKVDLVLGENKIIQGFGAARYAIQMSLQRTSTDRETDICYPQQGRLVTGDYEHHQQLIYNATYETQTHHANDPSYFLSQPVLLKMIRIDSRFAAVSSDHKILIHQVIEDNFTRTGFRVVPMFEASFQHLRAQAEEHFVPQLIFSDRNEHLYIIYPDQVIGGKLSGPLEFRNITLVGIENDRNFIGSVKVYDWHFFVSLGSAGVDVYRFEESGNIRPIMTINSQKLYGKIQKIFVPDVAIGSTGDFLYVLDQNSGVTRLIFRQNHSHFEVEKDPQLGLIDVQYGITIEEKDNSFLLVLCERGFSQYLVEVGLFHKFEWFLVKTHHLNGRYFSIDITEDFALLRGKDEHRVIRYGIYEEFEPEFKFNSEDDFEKELSNSYFEQYITIPKLQAVEFFSQDDGFNDPATWHLSKKHPFILGMTYHHIVEIPYFIQTPVVVCNTRAKSSLGRQWKYKMEMTSIWCADKYFQFRKNETYKDTGEYAEQQVQCKLSETYEINVVSGDGQMYNTEELVSITIGLIVLLVLLAFLLAYLYGRFKEKEKDLVASISGFDSNRQYQMEPNDV